MSRYPLFVLTPSSRRVILLQRHQGQNAPNQLCRVTYDLMKQSLARGTIAESTGKMSKHPDFLMVDFKNVGKLSCENNHYFGCHRLLIGCGGKVICKL